MKQPTKAELRDRIKKLEQACECNLNTLRAIESDRSRIYEELHVLRKKPNYAAYALLATLVVIVIMEVVL